MRARAHSAQDLVSTGPATYQRVPLDLPTFGRDLACEFLLLTALTEPDPPQQRAVDWLQQNLGFGPRKVNQAQSRPVGLVGRRADDPVYGALEVAATQELECVGNVDDDGVPRRPDVLPRTLGRLDLQPRHGLVEQKRQRVVVGVALGPDVGPLGVLLGGPREVLHVSQVLEPLGLVPMPPHEKVLILELQHVRKQPEQGQQQAVVHLARKGPDLVPVRPEQRRVRPLVLGRELGDVVPLVIVTAGEFARRLRLVAAEVALGRVALVLEFLLEGQREEGPTEGVLAADFSVGEAVSDDVEETYCLSCGEFCVCV